MSATVSPGPVAETGLHLVPRSLTEAPGQAEQASASVLLGIHRITSGHHGRTLLLLGHAAEHLANSRRFRVGEQDESADVDAIHILMRISRDVFDDYAGARSFSKRVEQWIVDRVVGLIC